jgi:hypothetical protein
MYSDVTLPYLCKNAVEVRLKRLISTARLILTAFLGNILSLRQKKPHG